MKKFLLPLLFLFLFLLESLFVQYLPAKPFGFDKLFSPHFLFAALVFLTIFVGKKQGILYSLIFGLIFDIVYIEIIGIYLFFFPFIAYLVSKLMNLIHANFLTAFFVTLLGVALLEMGVYEMDVIIHVTNLDFISFINIRFFPTLILNAAFILIAGYPLKIQFEKYAESLRAE